MLYLTGLSPQTPAVPRGQTLNIPLPDRFNNYPDDSDQQLEDSCLKSSVPPLGVPAWSLMYLLKHRDLVKDLPSPHRPCVSCLDHLYPPVTVVEQHLETPGGHPDCSSQRQHVCAVCALVNSARRLRSVEDTLEVSCGNLLQRVIKDFHCLMFAVLGPGYTFKTLSAWRMSNTPRKSD